MSRAFLAVLLGYMVFAASAVLLFRLSGVDPHGMSSVGFRVVAVLYGVVFAAISGWLTAHVSRFRALPVWIVGAILTLSGLVSLIARPGHGALWSQLATALLFGPASVVTGILCTRRHG